nr:hypothetical protein [Dissulfurimicrobium hydrothermale]
MKAKRLSFEVVNVQTPEGEHFIKDFGLFTSSLVLVEQENGRSVRYKNLARVWELASDDTALKKYVHDETAQFLKAAK